MLLSDLFVAYVVLFGLVLILFGIALYMAVNEHEYPSSVVVVVKQYDNNTIICSNRTMVYNGIRGRILVINGTGDAEHQLYSIRFVINGHIAEVKQVKPVGKTSSESNSDLIYQVEVKYQSS